MEIPRKNHTIPIPEETSELLRRVSTETDLFHSGVIGNGIQVWRAQYLDRTDEITISRPSRGRSQKTVNFNLEDFESFRFLIDYYGSRFSQWQIIDGAVWLTGQGFRSGKEYRQRGVEDLSSVSTEQLILALQGRGYVVQKR